MVNRLTLILKYRNLTNFLSKSDFISLHVPAQKNYVIDKNQFELMKDGVGLINAARGGVVNEVELVNALRLWKSFVCRIRYF